VFCCDFVKELCAKIDGFNVCVLLEFIERLYVVIDDFQCVFCCDFVKELCAEIDGFNGCVLLEFIERLYVVIDDFQCVCSVAILLKNYVLKLMISICVFCWNLMTVYMLGLLQHEWCVSMANL
jgi:hypothetical protein